MTCCLPEYYFTRNGEFTMNENAEMGYVLTGAIEGTAMLVKGSAYVVQEILRLLQWAMKKVQNRELTPGEYENLAKFIQKTGGNLDN